MRFILTVLAASLAVACMVMPDRALAATVEPTGEQINSAPCTAALTAADDDKIIASCGALIGNDKAPKADRVKAAIARALAYDRKGEIERAIGDDDIALRLDPTQADVFNARGELLRRKGDRVHALSDFGTAVKLDPNHVSARANYKSLSLEVERIGAMMAVNNKPSFNCATARRPVEKAICANPELANLDREINAVNIKVVRQAGQGNPAPGVPCSASRMTFSPAAMPNSDESDFDLQKMMRDRLDHLLALVGRF